MHSPVQVLMDLTDKMTALLTAMVVLADQDQHDAEVAQLKLDIAQAKEDLAAEGVRMAAEWAALDAQTQFIQAQSFRLTMDQNASNEVMRRRYQKAQSRLPPVYDPRNLFNTPGAGPSNPLEINQITAPGVGMLVQPPVMGPPRVNTAPPPYVPTPPGHYSNPLENMIAAAARLAALPVEGDSPTAVETRRVRELLQTALAQQEAYSYSRDRIHSTPRHAIRQNRSPSYSRHMASATGSSNVRRHDFPGGHGLAHNGACNVVDQDRARQEAEQAAQMTAYQPFPVYPTASIEAGMATRAGGVPCLVPALRNERLPKDFKGPRKVPNYRLIYSPEHGLRATRWLWSCWRSAKRQWPNTSP